MACTPGGCQCGHDHQGHQHGAQHEHNQQSAHKDTNQPSSKHGSGCCGGSSANETTDRPKVAEKA